MKLIIQVCEDLEEYEGLEEFRSRLKNQISLKIFYFFYKCKKLKKLLEWFGNLTYLKKLMMWNCKAFEEF